MSCLRPSRLIRPDSPVVAVADPPSSRRRDPPAPTTCPARRPGRGRRSTVSSDCRARVRTDLERDDRRFAASSAASSSVAARPPSPAGSLEVDLWSPVRGSPGRYERYGRELSVSSIGLADALDPGGEEDGEGSSSESGGGGEEVDCRDIADELQLVQLARSAERSLLEQAALGRSRGRRRASIGDDTADTARQSGRGTRRGSSPPAARERCGSDWSDAVRHGMPGRVRQYSSGSSDVSRNGTAHGASDFDASTMSLVDIGVDSPKELEMLLGRGDIPEDDEEEEGESIQQAPSEATADDRVQALAALLRSKDDEIATLRDRLERQDAQLARQRAVNRMLLDELRSDGTDPGGRLAAAVAELEATRGENARLARENERLRRQAGEGGCGEADGGLVGSDEERWEGPDPGI